MSVLLFAKQGEAYSQKAQELVEATFPDALVVTGRRDNSFPVECLDWQGDYLISYLSPWIIPDSLLNRARIASINFHPGPPEYPGIGCTNFAIYNNESTFGVTCHHMAATPDTGQIIAVKRFPMSERDSVYTLTQRCYENLFAVFSEIIAGIAAGKPLSASNETWTRKPYKRAELNALCRIDPEMSPDEIRRRIRAVTFPNAPGAYIEVNGFRFVYENSDEL